MAEDYLENLSIEPPDDYVDYVLSRKWMPKAKCRGVNPDFFYPERGASTKEAKEVCAQCPVERLCLEYGVQKVEKFGIWGGKSERDRRTIRRNRRKRAASGK